MSPPTDGDNLQTIMVPTRKFEEVNVIFTYLNILFVEFYFGFFDAY